MELIRGWERQYLPEETGSLRLFKGSVYRNIEEEDGIGDKREGEIRVKMPGTIISNTQGPLSSPVDLTIAMEDEPEVVVKDLKPGETREFTQNLRVGDSKLDSPFIFCLCRKTLTKSDWGRLRAALPERFDTWTITDDLEALRFEIEWGLKRWLALNGITEHRMDSFWGWVNYSFDTFPPGFDPKNVAEEILYQRWFQKSRKYQRQQEYRLAWIISSTQLKQLPPTIDIELTKTGISLFKPWSPPT